MKYKLIQKIMFCVFMGISVIFCIAGYMLNDGLMDPFSITDLSVLAAFNCSVSFIFLGRFAFGNWDDEE